MSTCERCNRAENLQVCVFLLLFASVLTSGAVWAFDRLARWYLNVDPGPEWTWKLRWLVISGVVWMAFWIVCAFWPTCRPAKPELPEAKS